MAPVSRRQFLSAGLALAAAAGGSRTTLASGAGLDVSTVTIAAGLRHPWSVAFLPSGDFLVTEKDGGLVRVQPDGTQLRIVGLPDDLDNVRRDPRDNSGLFDVALAPDFARSGRLFLTYASQRDGGTTTQLVEARLDGDRLADLRVLFEALPRTADRFHYGGALLVAGEFLYLSVGERHYEERDNPPLPAAQDPSDRRGKIYRLTLAGEAAPPDGHPHEWYASGIRATQGLAQHPRTGHIWFTDHGPLGGDELNVLRPGANYGWPVRTAGRYRNEGYLPGRTLEGVSYAEPAYTWADRTVAPTGLTVYHGRAFPEWHGSLIVAGLSRGNLWRAEIDGERVRAVEPLMRAAPLRLRNVKTAPTGELYAVSDEPNGRLMRLDRG